MNISKVSTQNFGKLEKWEVWDGLKLTPRDMKTMENIKNYIDATTSGQRLKIYGKIGTPNTFHPEYKYIRLKTYPDFDDMGTLLKHRPDARCADYSRHSLWFAINDRFLTENVMDFLNKQSAYINYCVKHPEHSLARRSVQVYEFK